MCGLRKRGVAEGWLWQALDIDDQCSNAWVNLGGMGGGSVQGTKYSKQQCYEKVHP